MAPSGKDEMTWIGEEEEEEEHEKYQEWKRLPFEPGEGSCYRQTVTYDHARAAILNFLIGDS
jgi:hypothetical protein